MISISCDDTHIQSMHHSYLVKVNSNVSTYCKETIQSLKITMKQIMLRPCIFVITMYIFVLKLQLYEDIQ